MLKHIKILDVKGFDASTTLSSRDEMIMPIGNMPESLSRRILVGIFLVGRLDERPKALVLVIVPSPHALLGCSTASHGPSHQIRSGRSGAEQIAAAEFRYHSHGDLTISSPNMLQKRQNIDCLKMTLPEG